MENPIVKEIARLTGGTYEIPKRQADQIDLAADPASVAHRLAGRIASYRQGVADHLNVDPDLIDVADVIAILDLSKSVKSYGGDFTARAVQLGPEALVAIGRRAEAEQGPVPVLYAHLLGREPDAAGLAFYQKCLRDGVPLWRVIQSIEESDEAKNA